jgi:hypothetical protein
MSLVSGAAREASARAAAAAFAAAEELITSQLNEGQLDFYRQTTSAVLEGEQALKLVCGEPGTGKTYACAAVEQRLRMLGVRCMAASFQMVVECPKTSLHGLLHSNPTSLTAATVVSGAALTGHVGQVRDHMEGYQVLLVDEISTTALFLFVALDMFLRAAFDESKPFGGKTERRLIPGNFKSDKKMQNRLYHLGADFDRQARIWYFPIGMANVDVQWAKIPGLSTPTKRARGKSAAAADSAPGPGRPARRRRTSATNGVTK